MANEWDLLCARKGSALQLLTPDAKSLLRFDPLQAGHIDRARFTPDANAYFTDQAVADFAASLGPLGAPEGFRFGGKRMRGGMTSEVYSLSFAGGVRARIVLRAMPDGKVEQFMISRTD